MRLAFTIAGFSLVACFATQADELSSPVADTPVAALQQMTYAVRHLNYKGVFVYQNGTHLSTLQVVHAWYGNQAHERLVSRDGSRREVLVDGGNVTYVRPASKSIVIMHRSAHPGLPVIMGANVWQTPYYHPQWGGMQRVAGQSCRMVVLKPQDHLRYARHICIDVQHALPLETEVVNSKGVVMERMLFTSLKVLKSVSAETFAPPVLGSGYVLKRLRDAQLPTKSNWHFVRLPAGFRVLAVRDRNLGPDGARVHQLVLSDGISTVSVFIAPPSVNDLKGHFLRSGALNVYTTTLLAHDVTVMGEVPKQTIREIVDGLMYRS